MTSVPEPRRLVSPNEQFEAIITTVSNPNPKYWAGLDVVVRDIASGREVAHTTRNISNPMVYHFVEQDGTTYFIISEDYHGGYGCIDLTTGHKVTYAPTRKDSETYEPFWCWGGAAGHDPVARTLTIDGCYWACPYDRITFDFSNPMQVPYKALHEEPTPVEPWEDDEDEE